MNLLDFPLTYAYKPEFGVSLLDKIQIQVIKYGMLNALKQIAKAADKQRIGNQTFFLSTSHGVGSFCSKAHEAKRRATAPEKKEPTSWVDRGKRTTKRPSLAPRQVEV